jgi:hypothetical protein
MRGLELRTLQLITLLCHGMQQHVGIQAAAVGDPVTFDGRKLAEAGKNGGGRDFHGQAIFSWKAAKKETLKQDNHPHPGP